MARMACAVAQTVQPPFAAQGVLAVVAPQAEADNAAAWSIDSEAIGSGWHESSWLLRRGLQVDENPPPEAIPPEWQWRWWIASCACP